jgi:glycerol-3-phosphate dehydrogenase (NAD(P)+)
LGDLITTCTSPQGRNRSFGEAVGRGQTVQQALAATESVIEGVATAASVVELAQRMGVDMPITQAVHSVLFAGRSPRDAITELMSRPLKAEV